MSKTIKLPAATDCQISQVQFRDGNWILGKIGDLCFSAKVFEEGSEFGIDGGNVSKLDVGPEGGPQIISYDRGWETEPRNAEGKKILRTLLDYFQDIYARQEALEQPSD